MKIDDKQLKKIKLVVFDLDGTLLADNGAIGGKTIELVKRLQAEFGVKFSFASGRLPSAMAAYCNELNITLPVIALDGSYICAPPGNKPVYEAYIKRRHINKAVKMAENFFVKTALCGADRICYTEHNEPILQMTDKFGARFCKVESYDEYADDVLEIFMAGENYSYVKQICDKLGFPFTLGLSCNCYKSQSYKGIHYLEVRKKGCTKKTGLIKLLKYLKISQKNCAVMGDWYNDRPLFETKAIKIALANAVPEIKYLADYITEADNNNDGAGEFLDMILKAKMGL